MQVKAVCKYVITDSELFGGVLNSQRRNKRDSSARKGVFSVYATGRNALIRYYVTVSKIKIEAIANYVY
jgi:hypothetical protein